MAFRPQNWVNQIARNLASAEWARLSKNVSSIRPSRLRDLREEAVVLRRDLDQFMLISGARSAFSHAELAALLLPGGTDWRWLPGIFIDRISPTGVASPVSGRELSGSAALWHDCDLAAVVARQIQNVEVTDLASFGLRIETLGFSGSFLSLAISLPPEALENLTRDHIIRLEISVQVERPINLYARLNVGNGPNTEEILRHLGDMTLGRVSTHVIEFDLAMTEMNEKRIDNIWLDLILEQPVMNSVIMREMIFSRHLRANV